MATKLTKLDAVNEMLETVGEAPVDDLQDNLDPSLQLAIARQAEKLLERMTVEILADPEWNFNVDVNKTLTRNLSNQILIPADALWVDPTNTLLDIIERDGKLYDRTNDTYTFTDDLKCDIKRLVDFDDASHPIPEPIKNYILKKAARRFHQRQLGVSNIEGYTKEDEAHALKLAKRYDTKTADYCALNNGEFAWIYDRS